MKKSSTFQRKSASVSHILIAAVVFFVEAFAQDVHWTHTNGPMGGVVGDIAINSKGDIYAGVYDDWTSYYGLYKSTDNGSSWNKIKTQFDDFAVYGIYITKEDHIFVGTNFQGRVYRSIDDGVTWENIRTGYTSGECWAFGQNRQGDLFAGDGEYKQLFKSTNHGNTWIYLAALSPFVFALDSNNIVYAGTFNGLFGTTDGGLTWGQNSFLANLPVSTILIDSLNGMYVGTGYYSGGQGVYYSSDGGVHWVQRGLENKVVLCLALDPSHNLYAGTLKDGVFKSTDGGQTWTQHTTGLYKKQAFRMKINTKGDIFVGSEAEGVYRSTDGGETFAEVGLPLSTVQNIVFGKNDLIFAATPSGVQSYNKKIGEWKNLGLHDVQAIAQNSEGELYAGTYADGLYRSTDQGNSWLKTAITADTLFSIYNVKALTNGTLLASTELRLRRSTDKGITWNVLPIGTSFFHCGIGLGSNGVVYIAAGQGLIFRSNDYGMNFESVSTTITVIEKNGICVSKGDTVFVADATGTATGGIYQSTDKGASWTHVLNNGGSHAVSIVSNGTILANLNQNLLISKDNGLTWRTTTTPLRMNDGFTEIEQDENGEIYLGTATEGLFHVSIITDVRPENRLEHLQFALSQNYPNPFNPKTVIRYHLPAGQAGLAVNGVVMLKVFDVLGREVTTLVNERQSAGTHAVDFSGDALSGGVYFYQLCAGKFVETRKMVLLR